jgi:hypothetical protein
MNSKSIGADLPYAWPTAELAVMGRRARRDRLPPRAAAGRRPDRAAPSSCRVHEKYANPYNAAERGYVDDVIDPPRPARRSSPACACCAPNVKNCRGGSTATCRCEARDPTYSFGRRSGAIVAAVEALWPRPVIVEAMTVARVPRWAIQQSVVGHTVAATPVSGPTAGDPAATLDNVDITTVADDLIVAHQPAPASAVVRLTDPATRHDPPHRRPRGTDTAPT